MTNITDRLKKLLINENPQAVRDPNVIDVRLVTTNMMGLSQRINMKPTFLPDGRLALVPVDEQEQEVLTKEVRGRLPA